LSVTSHHTIRSLLTRTNQSRIVTVPLCHHPITFVHARATVDVVGSILRLVPVTGSTITGATSSIDQVCTVATSPVDWSGDCHALGMQALVIMTVTIMNILVRKRENVCMGKNNKEIKYCTILSHALHYSGL